MSAIYIYTDRDPTVNDDQDAVINNIRPTKGVRWVNTTSQAEFRCDDPSPGAADWYPVGSSGGSGTDDQTAAEVPFTPDGDIAATDTQAAVVEVRDDADTKLAGKADTGHSHATLPTTDEKAALAGTDGSPADANRYVTDSDARLSDDRAPTAHTHTESEITDLSHDAVSLQGRTVAATEPTDGQMVGWNDSTGEWEPQTPPGSGGGEANTGTNIGTGSEVFESKSGTELRFRSVTGFGGISVTEDTDVVVVDGSGLASSTHTHTESDISDLSHDAVSIQGRAVDAVDPTDGQALVWNDTESQWEPQDQSGSGGTDDQTAAEVSYTPSGDLTSTDVQGAIDELEADKADIGHTHDEADIEMSVGTQELTADVATLTTTDDLTYLTSDGAGPYTVHGIGTGSPSRHGYYNDSNEVITFAHESASAGAADQRMDNLGDAGIQLQPGESIWYLRHSGTSRWDSIIDHQGTSSGSGDVTGPASSTDNAFARYDGTGGKTLQNGQTTEDDTGNVSVAGNIAVGGTVDGRDVASDGTKLDGIEANAKDDQVAAEVPFTPAGDVAATDVQAAIEELDTEKLARDASEETIDLSADEPHLQPSADIVHLTQTGGPWSIQGIDDASTLSFAIHNNSASEITVVHESGSAQSASERINCSESESLTVPPDGWLQFSRHGADNRWMAVTLQSQNARGLRETSGPTLLAMGAVADGELLTRSGNSVVGTTVSSTTESTITDAPSTDQDDYSPTGWDTATEVRINPGASQIFINGAATASVKRKRVYNAGSGTEILVFDHLASGQTAGNQIAVPGADISFNGAVMATNHAILPGEWVWLEYSDSASRWEVSADLGWGSYVARNSNLEAIEDLLMGGFSVTGADLVEGARFHSTGRSYSDEQSVAFAQSITIDLSTGNKFAIGDLTANITSLTIANGAAGQYAQIIFTQDATGGRTLSGLTAGTGVSLLQKPSDEDLALHSAAGAVTRVTVECDDDGAGGVVAYLRKATQNGWGAV